LIDVDFSIDLKISKYPLENRIYPSSKKTKLNPISVNFYFFFLSGLNTISQYPVKTEIIFPVQQSGLNT